MRVTVHYKFSNRPRVLEDVESYYIGENFLHLVQSGNRGMALSIGAISELHFEGWESVADGY